MNLWEVYATVLALALVVQAGLAVLVLCTGSGDRVWPLQGVAEHLAVGFGVGAVLVACEMVLFTEAGLDYSLGRLLVPWMLAWGMVGLSAGARRRLIDGLSPCRLHAPEWPTALLVGGFAILAGFLLLRAAVVPVNTWDGWAIWDLKARAFFWQGSLLPLLHQPSYGLAHLHYPPLYPLAGAFLYFVAGHPTSLVQALSVAFYLATLMVAHAVIRRMGAGAGMAALLTAGLGLAPNVLFWSQHFQAEPALLFYAVALSCWMAEWLRTGRIGALLVAALFAAGLVLTKVEGMLLCLPAVATVIVRAAVARDARGVAWRHAAGFLIVLAGLVLPWVLFPKLNLSGPSTMSLATLRTVIEGRGLLGEQLRGIGSWLGTSTYLGAFALVFPLLVVLGGLHVRLLRRADVAFVLGQALFAAVPYMVFFLGAPNWFSVPTLGRYLIVFTGLWYLTLAFVTVHAVAAGSDRLRTREVWVGVPLAVLAASTIASVPIVVVDLTEPVFNWRFTPGNAAGWRAGYNTSVDARVDGLLVTAIGPDSGFESAPGLNLSTGVNRKLRLFVRAADDNAAGMVNVEIFWRSDTDGFRQDQSDAQLVRVTTEGRDVVFTPPWEALETVDQLRVDIDGERFKALPALLVETIRTNSRLEGIVLGVADAPRRAPVIFALSLALVLLIVAGRHMPSRLALATVCAWFWIFGTQWVLADAAGLVRPVGGGYVGPFSLMRAIGNEVGQLRPISPRERPGWLDARDGASEFTQVIRSIERDCSGAQQVWFYGQPEQSHMASTFARQRGGYLLFPRDMDIITSEAEFDEKLRRPRTARAVVLYGRTIEHPGLLGRVIFAQGPDYRVICQSWP